MSYTKWNAESDSALLQQLGTFIKQHRLSQNMTQERVANNAGLSRSTLSLLERGEVVTLDSFIRVLRVLDLLHVMDSFKIADHPSPLERMKLKKRRKRAREKPTPPPLKSDW